MKKLKLITVFALTAILGLTSCQSEESTEVGSNPNTNSSTSPTASNYERAVMNDGSNDDFLDGNACIELLFPLIATVNGQQVTLLSSLDFSTVLNIMGALNDDSDSVTFNFPISVITSTYLEVVVNNQSELDALNEECENAESQGEDAISCIDIQFPVTLLTYSVNLEQTGSVVVQSDEQLYMFMTGLQPDELFAVDYPISATFSNGTTIQINSDTEFQNSITECVQFEEEEQEEEDTADEVEAFLSGATFIVETYTIDGVNTANNYIDWSIEFTNDLKVIATSSLDEVEGTYAVSSEIETFVNITFPSNTAVSDLDEDWIVSSLNTDADIISFTSKTDASITLYLMKI